MDFLRHKILQMVLTALVMSGLSASCAYAGMNLETDAAVSGIAVALNNYYARMQHPEESLVESVLTVADSNALVITDDVTADTGLSGEDGTGAEAAEGENGAKTIYYTDENGVLHEEVVGETLSATEKLLQEVEDKGPEVEITTDGSTVGTVYGTATLRLREKPDADSRTLTLLALGEQYTVIGYENEFYKIQVDDLEGYVFKDYIQTSKKTAAQIAAEKKAKEEEAARLKKEAEKALAEYEAARKKAEEEAAQKAEAESKEAAAESSRAASEAASRADETKVEAFESFSAGETAPGSSQTLVAQVETPPETVEPSGSDTTIEASSPAVTVAQTTQAETTKAALSVSSGPGAYASAKRTAIVAYAKQFLGGKYVYGGTSLTDGVDCSGFVMRVYEYFGYNIGRTSRDQAAKGRSISASELQPGDLVFYASDGTINHVSMYIGNGEVIHASNSTNGIIISKYNYRTPCKMCTYLD